MWARRKEPFRGPWALPLVCFVAVNTKGKLYTRDIIASLDFTWMTSRFNNVCHLERGRSVSVIRSPPSCPGVAKTSSGLSSIDSDCKASMPLRDCLSYKREWKINTKTYHLPQLRLGHLAKKRSLYRFRKSLATKHPCTELCWP